MCREEKIIGTQGRRHRGGGWAEEAMPPYVFVCQKEKIETKEKVEKISKQKLLNGCHQG